MENENEIFFNSLIKLQQINNSFFYKVFLYFYKKLFHYIMQLSSVAIILRIDFNEEKILEYFSEYFLNEDNFRIFWEFFQEDFKTYLRDSSKNSKYKSFEKSILEITQIKKYFDKNIIYKRMKYSTFQYNDNEKGFKNNNDINKSNHEITKNIVDNFYRIYTLNEEKEKYNNIIYNGINKTNNHKNSSSDKTNSLDEYKNKCLITKWFCKEFSEKVFFELNLNIIFIKRAISKRDRYSGNIAFPGGKCDKEDKNVLETSIRESVEEIGFDPLNTNNTDFNCFYLGINNYYGITIDLRYFVYSHVFLILDFKKKFMHNLILSPNEISDVVEVSSSYMIRLGKFIKINKKTGNNIKEENNKCNIKEEEEKYYEYVEENIFGKKSKIKKLKLNYNKNFLLYGLTLKMILKIINANDENNLDFNDDIDFGGSIFRHLFYLILRNLIRFICDSYKLYRFIKNSLVFFLICILLFKFFYY